MQRNKWRAVISEAGRDRNEGSARNLSDGSQYIVSLRFCHWKNSNYFWFCIILLGINISGRKHLMVGLAWVTDPLYEQRAALSNYWEFPSCREIEFSKGKLGATAQIEGKGCYTGKHSRGPTVAAISDPSNLNSVAFPPTHKIVTCFFPLFVMINELLICSPAGWLALLIQWLALSR